MNKFEKQLISLNSNRKSIVDENIFLNKLHERVEKAERNKETFVTAFALVFILFFSTYTQLGLPIVENTFYVEEIESNYFELDFWNISDTTMMDNSSYIDELAYFLLEEDNLWETMDLLHEIEFNKEITL